MSIDPKTGDLSFKVGPDFENPTDAGKDNVYEVEIRVEDGQGGLAVQSIRVKVTDAEETPAETVPPAGQTGDPEAAPEPEEPAAQPE